MLDRCVLTLAILGLLLAVGCGRDGIVAPQEPERAPVEDSRPGPPALTCEPQEDACKLQQEARTWSEVKRMYAGRPPKDNN